MSVQNSELFQAFKECDTHDDFEEYVVDSYNLLEFYYENEKEWSKDLEKLICNIHRSGLLKNTNFAKEIESIYKALDV